MPLIEIGICAGVAAVTSGGVTSLLGWLYGQKLEKDNAVFTQEVKSTVESGEARVEASIKKLSEQLQAGEAKAAAAIEKITAAGENALEKLSLRIDRQGQEVTDLQKSISGINEMVTATVKGQDKFLTKEVAQIQFASREQSDAISEMHTRERLRLEERLEKELKAAKELAQASFLRAKETLEESLLKDTPAPEPTTRKGGKRQPTVVDPDKIAAMS